MLGRPTDEINQSSLLSLLHPDDRRAVADNIGEMVRRKQGWRNKTIRCLHADGQYRFMECNSHPVFDDAGGVIGFRGAIRDVTEVKQTGRAIRESEALARAQLAELNQFYDNAPVGLCVVDTDLRVLRMNERLANTMRMSRSEIVGRTLHETVPRNAAVVEPIYRQVIATKTPVLNRELHGPPREGETEKAQYLISFHPLFDESGDVWACSTVVQDVTDVKRVERELRQRQEQHSTAQRIARLGHWDRDIIANELFWSDEVYRIFGVSHDEFGSTLESFLRFVHLDDLARVHEVSRAALAGERPYYIEFRIVRPSGELRVVEAQAHVLRDENDDPVRLVGTVQDITERKRTEESLAESERRYRTMLDSLAEGVISVDPDGTIVSCNTSATEILGLTRQQLLAFSTIESRWRVRNEDGETMSPDQFPVNVTLRTGRPVRNVILCVDRPDGSEVAISVNSQPLLRSDSRQPYGAVISFYDVTQQRSVQKELQEQRDKITHVTRVSTMGEMATGIAHELNQPLSAIANYAYSARGVSEGAPSEIAETLDRLLVKLEEQSVRAGTIVRRLRALVHKSPSERAATELDTLIHETFDLIGHDVRSAGIAIETEFDPAARTVLVDVVQIQQVLLNLIRNGIEAMQDTPGEQRQLRVATHREEDGRIAITVSDHGTGLPAEKLDKVFDAFFTTKQDGLGMGLAISRSIVEDHGGHLTVFANDDMGVTFCVTLPSSDDASVNT